MILVDSGGWIDYFRGRPTAQTDLLNTLRTVSGAHFLWLVLQHVLPKGFRRSRNFGLLHPNCKQRQRLALLRLRHRPAATVPCPAGAASSAAAPPVTPRSGVGEFEVATGGGIWVAIGGPQPEVAHLPDAGLCQRSAPVGSCATCG